MDETGILPPPPVTIYDLWRILRRRAPIAFFTLVVVIGLTLFITSKMPKVYQATARILVEGQTDTAVPQNVMDLLRGSSRPATVEIEKMRSRTSLEQLAQALGKPATRDTLDELKVTLNIGMSPDGQIMEIGARTRDPKAAQQIANTAASLYTKHVKSEYDEKVDQSQERLKRARDKAREEKEEAELALNAFNERMHLLEPSIYYHTRANQTVEVRRALEDGKRSLKLQNEQLGNLLAKLPSIPQYIRGGINREKNPIINSTKTQLILKEAERKQLLFDYSENSIEVKALDNQIKTLRESIQTASKEPYYDSSIGLGLNGDYSRVVSSIQDVQFGIKGTQQNINAMEKQLATLEAEQKTLAAQQSNYESLKRKREGANEAYEKARLGLINMEQTRIMGAPTIKMLEDAELPRTPVSPKPLFNTIMAIALGLLLGAGAAVLAEYLATGMLSEPEREDEFASLPRVGGVPLLGSLAVALPAPPGKSGLPALVNHAPRVEDALREIGFNLAHRGEKDPVPVVLFTGTRSDETTAAVAAQLAALLVRDGLKVTLVDADRSHPRLNQVFGKPDAPGMADILAGRSKVGDILHIGVDRKLRFLAAGSPDDTTPMTEEGLRSLFKELGTDPDTDIVIVSGPSVWQRPLVAPLERAAKGMVLVAPSERGTGGMSPAESVARARRLLSNGYKPRILGVVVSSLDGGLESAEMGNGVASPAEITDVY